MRAGPLALCVLVMAAGCQSSRWQRTASLHDTSRLIVEREQRIVESQPQTSLFDHPADLPAGVVDSLLAELHFRRPRLFREDEVSPVIPPARRTRLAEALAEALREAGSSERVRFSVSWDSDSIFSSDRITRGVAFVRPPGVLNLAFDRIDDLSDDDFDAPRFQDPTRRRFTESEIEPAPSWEANPDPEAARLLWVRATVPDRPAEKITAAPEDEAVERQPAEGPAEMQSPPAGASATERPLTDAQKLAQLRLLEQLHRDGAISDEEFERRRRQILDDGE